MTHAKIFALLLEDEVTGLSRRDHAALDASRLGRAAVRSRLEAAGYSRATASAAADVVEAALVALETGRMAAPLSGEC